MRRVILCPFHKEATPSCVVYSDGYKCFGCGKRGKLSEVGLVDVQVEEPEPEDLSPALAYIDSLPVLPIRGLELPMDQEGYYLVWPDRSFYKKRLHGDRKPKYFGPRGHRPPPFVVNPGSDSLVIVEGEINALSIAKACPEYTVCSPGSASNFVATVTKHIYTHLIQSKRVLLLADRDAPGANAVINLLHALRAYQDKLRWRLMPHDANQVLCGDNGIEALRQEVSIAMGSEMARGA